MKIIIILRVLDNKRIYIFFFGINIDLRVFCELTGYVD